VSKPRDEAQNAAAERLVNFQLDAVAEADSLDDICDVLDDAMLAHVLAVHPLAPESEAALPKRVRLLLRKARRGLN
jgi:hypothetical protein